MGILKHGPYSPSRLDTATCGYSFKKQYIDKAEKAPESLPQGRGSAIHEVFEQMTACFRDKRSFTRNDVLMWIDESVKRHPVAYQEVDGLIKMASLYMDRPPELTSDAGIELRLAVKMDESGKFVECDYESPDAFARGRADIMMISDDTTTARIIDHKSQPNVEEADTFQMGFYAWVVSKLYPFLTNIETVLHFAQYGSYSKPTVWSKEDLARVEDQIMTRVSIIENRVSWDPQPHDKCQYCPFILECPAMKQFIDIGPDMKITYKQNSLKILGSTQRAVEVAGFLNTLETIVKSAKLELKTHVKSFGPIAISGKAYEFRGKENIDWDAINKGLRPQAYAIFEKYNVDPKAFMSFNQSTSDSIWYFDNPELIQELAKLFPKKLSTEFSGYKI
jgi:CRISPR/Cas system-associated exonuclease Cas4 (RecB family)